MSQWIIFNSIESCGRGAGGCCESMFDSGGMSSDYFRAVFGRISLFCRMEGVSDNDGSVEVACAKVENSDTTNSPTSAHNRQSSLLPLTRP